MATITWKGDPEDDKAESTTWGGIVFKKGEAVETADAHLLGKAKTNTYFEVSGLEAEPDPPATWRPPSQQSAQGPVPKGGEPIRANPPMPKV